MALETKASHSDFEVESHDLHLQAKIKALRMLDAVRVSITALALLMAITILGVSANTIAVYNNTQFSGDSLLSLWPAQFNLQPTVALVAGSSIVLVANTVSILFSKVQTLRSRATVHTSLMFIAPAIGLIAALIAMVFFYAINSSNTVDTFISWTCRWKAVPMTQQPHWSTLCQESWAGVYLAILLIPVEALVMGLAGYQLKVEKYTSAYANARKGSPILS